jgi:hypothetical protein
MSQMPKIVAIRPAAARAERPRLFAALEAALPVSFRDWRDGDAPDALIAFDAEPLPARLPAIAIAAGAGAARGERVRFGDGPGVDRRVHGVELERQAVAAPLAPADEEAVLASGEGGPVWTRAAATGTQRVGCTLPELEAHQILRDALGSPSGVALIALVQFLRELTDGLRGAVPPLRAALLFDDPNLRWRSYGFIDYARLLAHADAHGYHASMAMIPIDVGPAHRGAARLFRTRPDRLSLVFHGNNHSRKELLAPGDDAAALALSAQALRRIERFEQRHALHVDRVMTPPHGRCSTHVARALGALGFDALCAIHPLPWTDTPPPERLLAGWGPADFAFGCPVIPRAPITSSHADLALRAFMDHPLVVYGHHEDVADGLEPLAAAAALVNRLGPVEWTSIGRIAEGNFTLRVEGGTAHVRAFSGRLRLELPANVDQVVVEAPRDELGSLVGWSPAGGAPVPFGASLPVAPGHPLVVHLRRSDEVRAADVDAPAWSPWPMLRRAATEVRDRALPLRPARA